jgi:hemin uptake protein HemP
MKDHQAATDERSPSREGPVTYTSRELFRDQRQIQIAHDGQTYLLRITRQGKLLLTK